jgi:hypothetical protein
MGSPSMSNVDATRLQAGVATTYRSESVLEAGVVQPTSIHRLRLPTPPQHQHWSTGFSQKTSQTAHPITGGRISVEGIGVVNQHRNVIGANGAGQS